MKYCVAAGTRPEWIKLAPVIKELQRRKLKFYVLNTGQHYSRNLSDIFFQQFDLPDPKYSLEVGSSTHGQQTGTIIIECEKIFQKDRPDVVIVEGDTNSVLGVAIAAVKLGIKVAHVEAGLRSYDQIMPEELNRVMVDHISSYLFAPTPHAEKTLFHEGIFGYKVHMVGNTIVDAIRMFVPTKKVKKQNRIVVTLHRQENTEDPAKLKKFVGILRELKSKFPKDEIIYVSHPRTIDRLLTWRIALPKNIKVVKSMGYLQFLKLVKSSKVVLTDSGGLQEEACIVGTPCVTLRENTERPETIYVGANRLSGVSNLAIAYALDMFYRNPRWEQPFGDGHSAKRIVDVLEEDCK